ncbi:hypothetical protein, partial [Escherichia coli]
TKRVLMLQRRDDPD